MKQEFSIDESERAAHVNRQNESNGPRPKALAVILVVASVFVLGAISFGIARYAIESSRPKIEQLPTLAEQAEANGNTMLAFSLRKQYCDKFPNDVKSRMLLSTAFARNGQFDSAKTELGKIGRKREIGSMLLAEANTFYDKSDFTSASFLYRQYLDDFDSSNVSARIDCGYALFQSGRRKEGKIMTQSVLKFAPEQPLALFNLGVMAAEENDFIESRAMFERCAAVAERQYPEIASKARNILKRLEALK